jgi:hypothetical protein
VIANVQMRFARRDIQGDSKPHIASIFNSL